MTLRSWRAQLFVFLLFFAAGLLFIIPRLSRYHGDEAFYTNAALRMVRTGDYWTPYFADGRARFLKPILSYWAVAGSYQIFGINYFSSRLGFVLAGCLVVYLTSRLSLAIFGRTETALASALVAGSNLQLLTLSTRSTPDILVTLFALVSWLGFARLIFRGDRSMIAYLLAYVGAALAVETKGLLGLFPVASSLLFCALAKNASLRWRDLLHLPSMLIALGIGVSWYAVVFAKNGTGVFAQFFSDQLTTRVSANPWYSVQSFADYTFAGLRHFLPWSLLVAIVAAANTKAVVMFYRDHRRECWYVVGTFLLLAICFSFGNVRRTRYVVMAYPLLAVLVANCLVECLQDERTNERLGLLLRWSAGTIVVVGLLIAAAGSRIDVPCLISGLALAACAVWLWISARPQPRNGWMMPLACLLAGGFFAIENAWRPVFVVAPTPQLAAALKSDGVPGGRVYAWQPRSIYPNQLRVLLGGKVEVVVLGETNTPPANGPLVLSETQTESLPEGGWRFSPVAAASRKWPGAALRQVFFGENPRGVIATNVESYLIAQRVSDRIVPAAAVHASSGGR